MRYYALLDADDIVCNVTVGDTPGWPDSEDVTDLVPRPGPGWRRIGPGQYTPPPDVEVNLTRSSRADILDRLTPAELHAWRRAVVRAEATNTPTSSDRALMKAWWLLTSFGDEVTVTHARVRALRELLVSSGVLASLERADAVLAGTTP